MADDKPADPLRRTAPKPKSRAEREAEALRRNLHRRKAQQRGRAVAAAKPAADDR